MILLEIPAVQVFFAGTAALGFAVVFNTRGVKLFTAMAGGCLGWLVFLAAGAEGGSHAAVFLAALAIGVFAEIMAIIQRCTATIFIVGPITPLVPGKTIYEAMVFSLDGNVTASIAKGGEALFVAGAIAMGVLLATALFRLKRRVPPVLKKNAR